MRLNQGFACPDMTLAAIVVVIVGALALLYAAVFTLSHKPRKAHGSELQYITAKSKTPQPLPTLADPGTIDLTVVIPCYNESTRLGPMLQDCVPALRKQHGNSWEILLVDDGSKDNTIEVAFQWARKLELRDDQLRVSKLLQNRGKGGAVTHGIKNARGKLILFADADGASSFSDANKLAQAIGKNPRAVAVGSRAHLVKSEAVVKRTFIRNFLMYALHTLLYVFGIRSIRDTQCGFKMFTRQAAAEIFPYMHTERWIFDVEVLIIAMRKNIPIYEVPISWHEVEGSKIDLARDSILMAIDLVVIRFAYFFGIYRDGSSKKDV